jgi:hypothetical protein
VIVNSVHLAYCKGPVMGSCDEWRNEHTSSIKAWLFITWVLIKLWKTLNTSKYGSIPTQVHEAQACNCTVNFSSAKGVKQIMLCCAFGAAQGFWTLEARYGWVRNHLRSRVVESLSTIPLMNLSKQWLFVMFPKCLNPCARSRNIILHSLKLHRNSPYQAIYRHKFVYLRTKLV